MHPALLATMTLPGLLAVDAAPSEDYAWLAQVVAVFLAVGVVAIAMMGSKRTHQD